MPARIPPLTAYQNEILAGLLEAHGEFMSGADLWQTLGFRAERSFQRAVRQGEVSIPLFTLAGRRGRSALTRDVAAWIATRGRQVGESANQDSCQSGKALEYGPEDSI